MDAHQELITTGKKHKQICRILNLFENINPNIGWTRSELANRFKQAGQLDLAEKSTMSARINDLINDKLIIVAGRRICTVTGRKVEYLISYPPVQKQQKLFFG